MPVFHSFDPPERFVAGTVGPPGQRTFFLQARLGARLTSVALEKQQVQALADRVDELLDELMGQEDHSALIPAVAPHALVDKAPLDSPIEEEFRAGTMTLSWDPEGERVVIEVFGPSDSEIVDDETGVPIPDGETPDELMVVRLAPGPARAFVERARSVLGAGRPECPFCGGPIDPAGHLCVRANGFHRRDP